MKTVLLLGGPAAGQRVEVHGAVKSVFGQGNPTHAVLYNIVPMCSHGEVHWFGVLDGADPLTLLIASALAVPTKRTPDTIPAPVAPQRDIVWAPTPAPVGVGMRPPSPYGTGSVKEGDDR